MLELPEVVCIMAGGRGSRLFGPSGGSKAMVDVNGAPLISYILQEGRRLRIEELVVTAGVDGDEIETLARSMGYRRISVISDIRSAGTLEPVLELLRAAQDRPSLLSTCDVYGPDRAIEEFANLAVRSAGSSCAVAFAASASINEDQPIWIHSDNAGVVIDYGKDVEPSERMFASVRVCSDSIWRLISPLDLESISTDTQLMQKLVRTSPHTAYAVTGDGIFDIDTPADLARARRAANI